MKRLFFIVVALSLTVSTLAQNAAPAKGYYMVIAAYNKTAEGYARRYSEGMSLKGHKAEYAYFPAKKKIFVYTKYYNDYDLAIADIASARQATATAAWIYINKQGPSGQAGASSLPPENDLNKEIKIAEAREEPASMDSAVTIPIVRRNESEIEAQPTEVIDNSKLVYFIALDARTQEPVDVKADFKDPISGEILAKMSANAVERLQPPSNPEKLIQASVSSFGWVTDAVDFNFEEPINDSTDYFLTEKGDTLVVLFDMHRMRRGDIQVLYNVYFIPDASLMRPISENQLLELLAMMEENKNLRIKLHGHTNGNSRGEYYRLSEEDTIFFAMNRRHEKTNGSAKQLSYDRANTIKRYLVHHGVSEERIEVEGWGGKRMIYDKLSKASTRNIRVEVEIIEE